MEDAVATQGSSTRWSALLAHVRTDRVEERHGAGVLVRVQGHPVLAKGCLLPDGTSTEARCVTVPDGLPLGPQAGTGAHAAAEDQAQPQQAGTAVDAAPTPVDPAGYVWWRRLPGADPLTRRGRVLVEPGVALRFIDEPLAGEGAEWSLPDRPSLERDLAASPEIAQRVRSDVFAQLLYAALCNTEWRQGTVGAAWSCSWRMAGDVVARLRGVGSYLDWYCSGGEGLVDEGVLAVIEELGWELVREAGQGAG